MLPVKLRDEALRNWEAIDPVLQHYYASCPKLLVAKLDKAENLSDRISLFYARSQKVDEGVEAFSHDLLKLAIRAFPEMSEEAKHHIVSQRFGQSLRPEIRDKLAANDFTKWAASLEAVKSVERFLKESQKRPACLMKE